MKRMLLIMSMFVVFLISCIGITSHNVPSPTPATTPTVVYYSPSSAEVICWVYDATGNGSKEWVFPPALNASWEAIPPCSGSLSISSTNAYIGVEDDWVWSASFDFNVVPGPSLGTITCDGTSQDVLVYKIYYCSNLDATYNGTRIDGKDGIIFVPRHP